VIFPDKYSAGPDASTGFALFRAYQAWSAAVKKQLRSVGLTHPQFTVMAVVSYLAAREPAVSQAKTAAMSMIDPMTISGIVRNLVRQGLIERRRNPQDSRAWSLALTLSGEAAIRAAFPVVEAVNDKFFGVLENQAAFRAQLHALRDQDPC
jgi:DNA-binding MarR family transcriptional regulator